MRHVIIPVAAALLVAGCSSGEKSDPFGNKEETTAEQLCDLVSPATLGEIFGGEYAAGKPSGTEGSPSCSFAHTEPVVETVGEIPIDHSFPVTVWLSRHKTVAAPLDEYFGVDNYEELTGLGDAAGFRYRFDGGYDTLLVVVDVEGGQRYLEIENYPVDKPDAEQTRPVAEEILAGLSS